MSSENDQLGVLLDPSKTSLDDLYAMLGKTSPQSNAFGGDMAQQGRRMLLGMRAQLKGAICGDDKIASHAAVQGSDDSNDMIALAAVVAALIPTTVAIAVNSTLVAALIVRIGIRKFCEGPEASP